MTSRIPLCLLVMSCSLFLVACKTLEPAKYSEFVRTTDFTRFDSYAIGEVEVSEFGRFYREAEVQAATSAALQKGIETLGYTDESVDGIDFTLTARWQLVSALTLRESSNKPFQLNTTPGGRPIADKRYSLVIEAQDSEGIFWVYESDQRINPREFTPDLAVRITEKAILRFPESTLF